MFGNQRMLSKIKNDETLAIFVLHFFTITIGTDFVSYM